MSARSFRSVFMVASCAGAALGCYLVSLHVASERAALEDVEGKILVAERDIRLLETEIGTRGRLAQLERWNVKVLALSAPTADQFLDGGFALARLIRPERKLQVEAPVVLASAPADAPRPQVPGAPPEGSAEADESASAQQLLHVASLSRPVRSELTAAFESEPAPKKKAPADTPEKPKPASAKKAPGKAGSSAAKPAEKKAPAAQKAGDKQAQSRAKPVTKPVRTAKVDPLAPLAASTRSSKSRETGPTR